MNNEIVITNHNPQDITITQEDNQLIFVNGGGEVIGITDVLVNGTSVVTNNIAYVIVPTLTSQLTNDSGYITTETDPTVPSYVKTITRADINSWNNKQEALVSGTNIKTINNTSLLGSGNIYVGGADYSAGTGISIDSENVISNTITSYNQLTDLPTIPTKTSDLLNDSDFVSEDDLAEVSFTGSYNSLSDTPIIPDSTSELINDSNFVDTTALNNALSSKQDTLVSGTNIKTINNNSLLGSGNISISGGTATDVQVNGTSIVSNNTANIITESVYNSSSNKIATKNDTFKVYSTSETLIGKWIDNSNVYRCVIQFTSPSTQDDYLLDISSLDIKQVINYNGINTTNNIPLNFYIDIYGSIYFSSTRYYNGNMYIRNSPVYGNGTCYLIIEYTKN